MANLKQTGSVAAVAFAAGAGAGYAATPPVDAVERLVYADPGDAQNAMRALCRAAQVTSDQAIIAETCDGAPFALETKARALLGQVGPRESRCSMMPSPAKEECFFEEARQRRERLNELAASHLAKERLSSEADKSARCAELKSIRTSAGLPIPTREECDAL